MGRRQSIDLATTSNDDEVTSIRRQTEIDDANSRLREYRARRTADDAGASHWNDRGDRGDRGGRGGGRGGGGGRHVGFSDLPLESRLPIVDQLPLASQLALLSMNRRLHAERPAVQWINRLRYILHALDRGFPVDIDFPADEADMPRHRVRLRAVNHARYQIKNRRMMMWQRFPADLDRDRLCTWLGRVFACRGGRTFLVIRAKPKGEGVVWRGTGAQLSKYEYDAARFEGFLDMAPRDDSPTTLWWQTEWDLVADSWDPVNSTEANTDDTWDP